MFSTSARPNIPLTDICVRRSPSHSLTYAIPAFPAKRYAKAQPIHVPADSAGKAFGVLAQVRNHELHYIFVVDQVPESPLVQPPDGAV